MTSITGSDDSRRSGLYTPLRDDRDEIRVLTLESFHDDGVVHCRLEIVSLLDYSPEYSSFLTSFTGRTNLTRRILRSWTELCFPQIGHFSSASKNRWKQRPHAASCRFTWGDFAALSYVWGTSNKERHIVVNGITRRVTRNLDEALRRLARSDEFRGEYKIWIDAVCINQEDEQERAVQVRKMRQIYSSAWKVISWLGENDAGGWISKAFAFSNMLASLQDDSQDLRMLCNLNSGILTDAGFHAMHEMTRHLYWHRLWIIQEVVMGASYTVLRCGDHHLDWDTLCRAISVLYHGDNWSLKDEMLKRAYRRGISTRKVWNASSLHLIHLDLRHLSNYEDEGTSSGRLGLRRLLEVANSAKCLEPRDKVFALAGMMETEIANEVTKAYSLDIPQLFAAVTIAFIKHYNNLEPLRQGNPWGPQTAPTWAADWSWKGRLRWSRPETPYVGPLWDVSDPGPRPEDIYNAHGGLPARYVISEDGFSLHCDGFIFDEIVGLGAREFGIFEWVKGTEMQCPSWRSCYGDDQETAQALSRLLLGGSTVGRHEQAKGCYRAVLSLPSTFKAGHPQFRAKKWSWLENREGYYYKWSEWRKTHNHMMLGKRSLESFFTDKIPEKAEESAYTAAFVGIDRTVKERRFMLTGSGRFGWAPDNAFDRDGDRNQVKIGDLIAIVFGCSTPLVIRRFAKQYWVIGEAYVEGIMNGEAITFLEDESFKKESFVFL
ncbi:unnamed protein product [Clonostachys chloroleuca]|uniref:Heterokaryon incompatibility domain-containing protein n=1 Tax=Clonostachys chloroleuca TaxID=1926264 RepID=A0AA35Q7I9_9HYPO|nr:unnamed protein product [Clonostachys chloroleuca]